METAVLISPSGNLEVIPTSDVQAKLAEGYITEAEWQKKQAERSAEWYQNWLSSPETEAERFMLLRQARDAKISATDYLIMLDYPISGEKRAAVEAYRTALRDLPAREGAPWDGGGAKTPWPEAPEL